MKLSLIVTVYNCEKYLVRCFESLKKQSYNEFEIVIVDDGSNDMSAYLCDEFAKERTNVKVIHKVNGGTVSARKVGIEAASGQVVCFVDGDDWIDEEFCLRLLYPFLGNNKIDVVSSGLLFEYIDDAGKNSVLFDGAEPRFYEKVEIENHLLPNLIYDSQKGTLSITTSVCCKMVKRDIALDAMNDMDERLTIGEDGAYVLAVLSRAQGVYVMKEALYHYEQHSDSQNYKYDISAFLQVERLQKCMNAIATRWDKQQLLKQQVNYYVEDYLRSIEKSLFGINEDGRVYLFPADSVKSGSSVVIHGAGKVGHQYINFIKKTSRYKLVAWTDKNNGHAFKRTDIPCSISEITSLEYDYIVLAANEKHILRQMKGDICNYNIPEEKIIEEQPVAYRI